jgi:hypothetical protein
MAASGVINIKTGSKTENSYKFCKILLNIGNEIAQNYVERIIVQDAQYQSTDEFFSKNKILIEGQFNNTHFNSIKRIISKHGFELKDFDIGACASIIQNIFASDSKYKNVFIVHPNSQTYQSLRFHESALFELRDLRNQDFAHIVAFEMEDEKFKESIKKIETIFSKLTKGNDDFKVKINEVMNETITDEAIMTELKNKLEYLIADTTLIKDFLNTFKDKIDKDRHNFQDIKNVLNKIDSSENSKEIMKFLDLMRQNQKAVTIILSNEFKQAFELMKEMHEK